MDWDRLSAQMVREMIRQFLREPGDFLTFGQLAHRIPNSDRDVLHSIAENRPDLFSVTRNERSVKLHTETVRRVLEEGIEAAAQEPTPAPQQVIAANGRIRCGHFAQEELLADLQRSSLPAEALTRNCCWTEICRLRSRCRPPIDYEEWQEICTTRGYLLRRQNPRGF